MKDHQVKHYLYQAIDRVTFEQILDRRTSKIVWDSLKSKFGGNAKVKQSLLNTLRRDFEILQMKHSETIAEYFVRVTLVANQMRSNGETMPDTKVVEKVLRTLTERFTYVVVSIEESKDVSAMTIDELQSSLVVHEAKFKRLDKEHNEEHALRVSIGDDRFHNAPRERRRPTYQSRGRGRGRQGFGRATVKCFKCHKQGHFQYECPTWERNANYVELDDEEELLLMAHVEPMGSADITTEDDEDAVKLDCVKISGDGVVSNDGNDVEFNVALDCVKENGGDVEMKNEDNVALVELKNGDNVALVDCVTVNGGDVKLENDVLLLMAHSETKELTKEEVWFIDSGCSNHMTGNKKWFVTLDESFSHSVKLGNNARMQVMGQGNVKLKV
jgi:RNase H-fold protein (predicted Holliday junction resolvase)